MNKSGSSLIQTLAELFLHCMHCLLLPCTASSLAMLLVQASGGCKMEMDGNARWNGIHMEILQSPAWSSMARCGIACYKTLLELE